MKYDWQVWLKSSAFKSWSYHPPHTNSSLDCLLHLITPCYTISLKNNNYNFHRITRSLSKTTFLKQRTVAAFKIFKTVQIRFSYKIIFYWQYSFKKSWWQYWSTHYYIHESWYNVGRHLKVLMCQFWHKVSF